MLYYTQKKKRLRKAKAMSSYRYARDSRTSAQRYAREWQRKVDAKIAIINFFDAKTPGQMTASDVRRYNLARAAYQKLMADNPNEPI
jgi:hypothetical protein